MHRKRSLLHRITSNRAVYTFSSPSRASSSTLADSKTCARGFSVLSKPDSSPITTPCGRNRVYRIPTTRKARTSSSYREPESQTHESRLQRIFNNVGNKELTRKAFEEGDELASKELERRQRETRKQGTISIGGEMSDLNEERRDMNDGRSGEVNPKKLRGMDLSVGRIEDRTVLVTPWRGAPTFLHIVAFVRELEKRYGKVQWCGSWRDEANPYEYSSSIIVIFESPTSLRKMPGLSFTSPSNESIAYQSPTDQGDPAFNSRHVDMGPSTSLDPMSNPSTQDMLRRIQIESEKLKKGKGKATNIGEGSISPLFMPWSEKLDEKAFMNGGPGLEDVLPFLEGTKLKGQGPTSGVGGQNDADDGAKEKTDSAVQKATWTEFDEPINIDAVVRKWEVNRLYLPRAAHPPRPYLRPSIRLTVAQTFVDFSGFSEEPVESMEAVVRKWKAEADAGKAGAWMPFSEDALADAELCGVEPQEEESSLDSGDWDLFPVEAWVADEVMTYEKDESELLPKQGYQRIGEDPELDEEEEDVWEGLGTHPLQFPESVRASDRLYSSSPTTATTNTSKDSSSLFSTSTTRSPTQVWDNWRSDPRPFRNGLGRDDPASLESTDPNQTLPPTHSRIRPKPWQWTKPGLASPSALQKSAMQSGSHSHSTASQDWEKDKRGRKMKRRDERMDSEGVVSTGLDGWNEGELDSWRERDEKARREEVRSKTEKDLKARLRAILDGTNVN